MPRCNTFVLTNILNIFSPTKMGDFHKKCSSAEISSVEVYAQLVVSLVCRNETATFAPVFWLEPWMG